MLRLALISIAALSVAGAAQAQDLKLSGDLAVVSDYRFRGYSLSDEQPAVQGGLTLTGSSGFYAGAWASTIDEYGADAAGKGATVEFDLSLGRAFSLGAYDFDVGLAAYTYPGGQDVNFVEIPVSVARTAGAWTWTLGGAYAPAQANTGDEDNTYVYGSAALAPAAWPVSLDATLGWEDGAFADGKTDWSLGVSKSFGPVSLSARYVGTDAAGVDSTVVASLGVAF